MRVTVLMRYPKAERAPWKRDLVESLAKHGFTVSIVFGEKSKFRHAKAALRTYGVDAFRRGRALNRREQPLLWNVFESAGFPCYSVADLNAKECVKLLVGLNPDWLLLLGTGIIRKPVLEVPARGCVHQRATRRPRG